MKILFVQNVEGQAGSEKYWMNLLPALKKGGLDVTFLAIVKPIDLENIKGIQQHMDKFGVGYHEILYSFPNPSFYKRLHKYLLSENFDIVHTHLLKADLLLSVYTIIFNSTFKLVSTKHGYEENYINNYGFDPSHKRINVYYLAAKFAERQMDASFSITHGLHNLYTGLGICRPEKLSVIHYGFDFEELHSKNDKLRYTNRQLIIVGRFTEFKGHRFAFQALQYLLEDYNDLKLILVGFGALEDELRKQVVEMGIEDRVLFEGHKTNAREYMTNSDIVLVPSVSEGFGIVLLEAFASKTPVIAFDVPSPSEIIEHEVNGILCPPFDTKIMAQKISYLLDNPDVAEQIAQHAYDRLKNYFTLERMMKETLNFYNSVLGR